MDCVIKIIRGAAGDEGQEFRCSTTETVIGRSPRSQIRLNSPMVSYEHAVITRNGDDFYIENLSAGGTFVNEERISGRVRLRTRDQLRLGQDTLARVEAMPAGAATGGRRRVLIYATIAMVVVLIVVLLADPFATTNTISLKAAYPILEEYAAREVASRELPPQALKLLREAWRLDMSGDRKTAQARWRDLSVLLSTTESKLHLQEAADNDRHALERIAKPPARKGAEYNPSEEELKAALVQFVSMKARS